MFAADNSINNYYLIIEKGLTALPIPISPTAHKATQIVAGMCMTAGLIGIVGVGCMILQVAPPLMITVFSMVKLIKVSQILKVSIPLILTSIAMLVFFRKKMDQIEFEEEQKAGQVGAMISNQFEEEQKAGQVGAMISNQLGEEQNVQADAKFSEYYFEPKSVHSYNKVFPQHSTENIEGWLFKRQKSKAFPASKLKCRNQDKYKPKCKLAAIPLLETSSSLYTKRVGIYQGGITDLEADGKQMAAGICDSNNGDLLTGCGFGIATAIINAAGPELQRDLYNKFGVPRVMKVSAYGQLFYQATEGRGYSITCSAYDMNKTHGISRIEYMTVPMFSELGVNNMYAEAFKNSKDLDFLIVPMCGMSHPVLNSQPGKSAQIATNQFIKFMQENPDSKLKIIFVVVNNEAARLYKEAFLKQAAATS